MKPMKYNIKLMILGLLVGMSLLTSCTTNSSEELSTLQIYQPNYLTLKKGTLVQTPKGQYKPQLDETWVSLELYRKKEQENINLATQVRKLTAQIDLGK